MTSRLGDVVGGPTLAERRAAFADEVREALAHLYDLPYLQTHPLTRVAARSAGSSRTNLGKTLHQALQEAIESLRPDSRVGDPRAERAYQLLTSRYVESKEIGVIVTTLGTSRSEYFRDHRQAIDAVASLLAEKWGLTASAAEEPRGQELGDRASRVKPMPGGSWSAPAPPLPQPLTSFVGRERERNEVARLLSLRAGAVRLLTLTGAGGCGKSRLALEVARYLALEYPDGAWLVELAAVSDPELVPPAVAQVFGVQEAPPELLLQTLARTLAGRQLLIVLDNCEHVVVVCAALAEAVLQACPRVQILATSREALGIGGEVLWRVPSLAVPPLDADFPLEQLATYDAIRLFVDRARDNQPHFDLTRHNARPVVEICRRLDGIPLAIELAARIRVFAIEQVADHLDDRFRLLTAGSRTALPRQQTLRASIDWSYDLLSGSERVVFNRLAVFVGGFTLEAAEAVCEEGAGFWVLGAGNTDDPPSSSTQHPEPSTPSFLDLLLRLVEKSLIVAESGDGEANRFRLLETLRQFAQEKLAASGEIEVIARRYAHFYRDFAEQAEPELRGADQVSWLERIDQEQSNLRAALDWFAARGHWGDGLRLAGAIAWFWIVRGHYAEGRARLTDMLAGNVAIPDAAARAKAYDGLAGLATRQGDLAAAGRYREAFLAAAIEADDKRLVVRALMGLPGESSAPGQVRAHLQEALSIARAAGLRADVGRVLVQIAVETYQFGDLAGAGNLLAEAIPILREVSDAWNLMFGLRLQFTLDEARGDYTRARAVAEETQRIAGRLGDASGRANSLMLLGEIALAEGDLVAAYPLLAEARGIYQAIGDHTGVSWADADLSDVQLRQGEVESARILAEEGLALARESGWGEFLLMTLHVAADVALALGKNEAAASHLREGLVLIAERPEAWRPIYLDDMARVAAAQNAPARALRLASAASADRAVRGMKIRPLDQERQEQALRLARESLTDDARSAALAEGQAMTMDQAVTYALADRLE